MADYAFIRGFPEWADFTTNTIKAMLLLDTYTPDTTVDEFVADIVADEATNGSYARQTLAGKSETIDVANEIVWYDATDPDFGALVGGESLAWMVVYRFVTNDADSILMAAYRIAKVTDGSNVTVSIDPSGLVVLGLPS